MLRNLNKIVLSWIPSLDCCHFWALAVRRSNNTLGYLFGSENKANAAKLLIVIFFLTVITNCYVTSHVLIVSITLLYFTSIYWLFTFLFSFSKKLKHMSTAGLLTPGSRLKLGSVFWRNPVEECKHDVKNPRFYIWGGGRPGRARHFFSVSLCR
jgi:hypothetical protein